MHEQVTKRSNIRAVVKFMQIDVRQVLNELDVNSARDEKHACLPFIARRKTYMTNGTMVHLLLNPSSRGQLLAYQRRVLYAVRLRLTVVHSSASHCSRHDRITANAT